jgi:Domain of unknown function (DUF4145)
MTNMKKTELAPCSSCIGNKYHDVLFEEKVRDLFFSTVDRYAVLRCRGCLKILMSHVHKWETDEGLSDEKREFYPYISRQEPDWIIQRLRAGDKTESNLIGLLREIYQALHGGQYRLAAIGIRALLEQIMIMKVGDLGKFDQNLDAFKEKGYISPLQRDAMAAVIEIGHAATHRGFTPTEEDLKVALDVVEGVLESIFVHPEAAEKIADPVPPRARPPKKS